jgi:ribonuclease HII
VPDLKLEKAAGAPAVLVAGVDEAGRGPLAGPVVAAAVVLPGKALPRKLSRAIDDSKQLLPAVREELCAHISGRCAVGVGRASAPEIDEVNILQATFLAMRRALEALPDPPGVALVDGNRLPPGLACRCSTVVDGDRLSLSIAAASIVAKVTRDRLMTELAAAYPGYGWETNFGYATAEHRAALRALGPCAEHRRTFRSVCEQLDLGL